MKQNQENQEFQYLSKIPIWEKINNMLSSDYEQWSNPRKFLNNSLKFIFKDEHGYNMCRDCFKTRSPGYDKELSGMPGTRKQGFFACYEVAKKWLKKVFKEKQVLSDLSQMDQPYRLAIELFQAYIEFRRDAKYARWQNGYNDREGEYKPNIRDLFTDDDLIQLGGNEFIKDCYQRIDIEFNEDMAEKHGIKKKPQIQNIDSRTGTILEAQKNAKPDLFKRVDNYLSWKIFKDGNVTNLTDDEISILKEAMKK